MRPDRNSYRCANCKKLTSTAFEGADNGALVTSGGLALNLKKKGKSVGIQARNRNFCTCGLNFLLLFTGLPTAVQPYSIKCNFVSMLGTVIDVLLHVSGLHVHVY